MMALGTDAFAFAETHHVAALLVFRSERGFVTRVSPALDALGALAR